MDLGQNAEEWSELLFVIEPMKTPILPVKIALSPKRYQIYYSHSCHRSIEMAWDMVIFTFYFANRDPCTTAAIFICPAYAI